MSDAERLRAKAVDARRKAENTADSHGRGVLHAFADEFDRKADEALEEARMSRILVVEDDDGTRYALSKTLEAAGFAVAQAHDYRDALPILEGGGHVDLLLIDLVMPGVNGFALARMARMRHLDIKVVYVTGYDDIPVIEAMGPILRKPVDPETLIATIRRELSTAA